MRYGKVFIDFYENTGSEPAFPHGIMRLNAGARIIKSSIAGPLFLNKNTQVGPDAVVGKHVGINENCYIARATIGS